MAATAAETIAFGAFARRGEREGVGHFERAGQEAGGENGADGARGIFGRSKADSEARAIRGQGKEF